ncbi:MAG TPA: O-antigen ligase family protein [Streptosporangiaceae bacterium]|jgi:O-antigen ligase
MMPARPALLARPRAAPLAWPRADAVSLLTCYLVLLMAIPSSLVVGSFGAAGGPAALFAVVLAGWYLVGRQHPAALLDHGQQPVRVAAAAFGCSVVASYVAANRMVLPGPQRNGADRGLLVLTGWLGVALLAADGIDGAERLQALIRRIVTGATAMAALGIAEFLTGVVFTKYVSIPGLTVHAQLTDLISRDGLSRVIATAAQPLEFTAVLAMCLPLALYQARFAAPGRRRWRWTQVVLIAGALPMTVSRSAIVGLAVICAVLIPAWSRRDRRRAYLVLVIAPVAVWLAKPGLLTSFAGLFRQLGSDSSSLSRTDAYSAAVPFIAHHPWLGSGFQTFFPQTYFFVDNQYLTSLIEDGVIGLAALVALLATGWFTARSARHASADPNTRELAQCLAASVAAAAACFATFDALSFTIASGLCFLLVGCTGALWRLATAARRSSLVPPARSAS